MTAPEALKSALRDRLGPALRAAGFKGSAPTWVLGSPTEDRAIVNVQSSDSSSRAETLFTVNLAVVPRAWWRWESHKLGKTENRTVKEYDGLWRERLRARQQQALGRPEWWSVTDQASAHHAVDDVVAQMENGATAHLRALVEPGAMLAAARTGRLGHVIFDTRGAVAVLLTENGASGELFALLDELETLGDARMRSIFWPMAQWCREAVR
ncbi:DUF4304 domain-containing protein [Jatrophihabitans telluris]|uniref:DUF4304 domain-containing protein n=1 Tax=Jatrophihabitans telluris TaxID=2038343 RepID=A0ABY4R024_9ACTN|nr:DUF4304 domain-containing protein [Jatrophihabitans telluris]UQX89261.1 DUF4304 domain-containing protein [Jatrophihabitans telluris]